MSKILTGYPSIDLPQSREAKFLEKHPIIPSIDVMTILFLLNRKNGNNIAIDSDELQVTYNQFKEDSKMLARAFRELGVKKGQIITIPLPSNYQALCVFGALNLIGAVTTFIDEYATDVEVLNYLSLYTSPILVNFDKTPEQNEYIKKNSNVKYIITLDSAKRNSRDFTMPEASNQSDYMVNFHTLASIGVHQRSRFHLPNSGSDDALILYTSGSSGEPKAVVLTNKNILAAQIYAGKTSHTENITATKTMTCVPLRYPYGFVTSLLTSLMWQKTAIMTPGWDSKTAAHYLAKEPNIIFGSPSVDEVIRRNTPEGANLNSVDLFISGGDYWTKKQDELAREFYHEHGNDHVQFLNGFGNAENVSLGSTPVGVPFKENSAGKILVGTTPLVIDKDLPDDVVLDGNALEEKKYGEVGELCISGENIFKEYFGNPEKTELAKFVRGGKTFFRTGTIGYVDQDGYFYPMERKSRFFIRSTGHKVYMDNVQNIVEASCDKILDAAAVKVKDPDEIGVVKVYVVLKEGVIPNEDTIKEIYDSLLVPVVINNKLVQLKEYEIPRFIEFIDEIPKIKGSEKPDYKLLEQDAEEKHVIEKTL